MLDHTPLKSVSTTASTTSSAPLVTVLITSYQQAAFIKESILSIVHQTYKNIQLIVIDDGSADTSPGIIHQLAEKYGFEVLLQKNTGLANVLNHGITIAQGKYFVSMGGDDTATVDRIEKQVQFMESQPDYAICGGHYIEIDAESKAIKTPKTVHARALQFEDLFTRKQEGIKAPTAMVRTDVLREVGGYDPDIQLEDIYMWLKITSAGHKAYIMEDFLANYRKHSNNQSKNMAFMLENFEKIYARYQQHPECEKVLNRIYINLFNKAIRHNYPGSWEIFRKVKLRHYSVKHISNIVVAACKIIAMKKLRQPCPINPGTTTESSRSPER